VNTPTPVPVPTKQPTTGFGGTYPGIAAPLGHTGYVYTSASPNLQASTRNLPQTGGGSGNGPSAPLAPLAVLAALAIAAGRLIPKLLNR
jgi:hypothetical protein